MIDLLRARVKLQVGETAIVNIERQILNTEMVLSATEQRMKEAERDLDRSERRASSQILLGFINSMSLVEIFASDAGWQSTFRHHLQTFLRGD